MGECQQKKLIIMQVTNPQLQEFILVEQLGKGSFGTVHKGKHSKDQNNKLYAIKIQTLTTPKPMLHIQYQLLNKLHNQTYSNPLQYSKGFCFPSIHSYKQSQFMSYMAMEMLDTTLQDFANKEMKNVISKDCLVRVFYNLLRIVQHIHRLGYVHRDIKPANFMLKANREQKKEETQRQDTCQKYLPTIYPIDLGLCKSYINPTTRQHITCKENKKMVGTALFCSLNTHKGIEQSRRDDIQAIVYLVAYLVKKLPWETIMIGANNAKGVRNHSPKNLKDQPESPKKKTQEKPRLDKYEEIYQIKKSTNFDEFFNDPDLLPKCLLEVYKTATKMSFQEQPNYSQIYDILEKQHYQLTGLKVQLQNFPCKWENLTVIKPQTSLVEEKKKIKINFKIPPNKLKKPTSQMVVPQSSSNSSLAQNKVQDI